MKNVLVTGLVYEKKKKKIFTHTVLIILQLVQLTVNI